MVWSRGRSRGTFATSLRREDLPLLVGCALLGVAANQLLFINGLARTGAINANILGTVVPVFTASVAMLLGRERFRTSRAVGIAIALAGALVIFGIGRLSFDRQHLGGNGLILANSLCYATYLVLVRDLSPRAPPMTLVALLFAISVPAVLPFGVPAWIRFAPHVRWRDIGLLVYLVAVPTVGAYSLLQAALAEAESSLAAVYIYLQPIVATLGAVWLLNERLTHNLVTGGALILGGLAITMISERLWL
jgi:drug/metabolite transporter (DMT)-like permease